ncbi:hypothetical protein B0O99DRAFT_616249, partial [Bisporella sp. PMI_857]
MLFSTREENLLQLNPEEFDFSIQFEQLFLFVYYTAYFVYHNAIIANAFPGMKAHY